MPKNTSYDFTDSTTHIYNGQSYTTPTITLSKDNVLLGSDTLNLTYTTSGPDAKTYIYPDTSTGYTLTYNLTGSDVTLRNYNVDISGSITISPKPIVDDEHQFVITVSNEVYDGGNVVTPTVTVKDVETGKDLEQGSDKDFTFEVVGGDKTEVPESGDYEVVVHGVGNYSDMSGTSGIIKH